MAELLVPKILLASAKHSEAKAGTEAFLVFLRGQETKRQLQDVVSKAALDPISAASSCPVVTVGVSGGLGNQLFQLATSYAVAQALQKRVVFPHKKHSESFAGKRPVYWSTVFRQFPTCTEEAMSSLSPLQTIQEWKWTAKEVKQLSIGPADNVRLEGYFQCPAFFVACGSRLRSLVAPSPQEVKTLSQRYLRTPARGSRAIQVSIGVRQGGDFGRLGWKLSAQYYEAALRTLLGSCSGVTAATSTIFVFSDPDGWPFARDQLQPLLLKAGFSDIVLITDETDVQQMWLMTLCTHHIVSNSTFHWWGAWLAHSPSEVGRMVVCPKKWPGNFQSSIVPAGWQTLDVPHPSSTNSASSEIAAVLLSDTQKAKAAADMDKKKAAALVFSFLS